MPKKALCRRRSWKDYGFRVSKKFIPQTGEGGNEKEKRLNLS